MLSSHGLPHYFRSLGIDNILLLTPPPVNEQGRKEWQTVVRTSMMVQYSMAMQYSTAMQYSMGGTAWG
jgi:hypothetical protein